MRPSGVAGRVRGLRCLLLTLRMSNHSVCSSPLVGTSDSSGMTTVPMWSSLVSVS